LDAPLFTAALDKLDTATFFNTFTSTLVIKKALEFFGMANKIGTFAAALVI